jgi:hypothetical protein
MDESTSPPISTLGYAIALSPANAGSRSRCFGFEQMQGPQPDQDARDQTEKNKCQAASDDAGVDKSQKH